MELQVNLVFNESYHHINLKKNQTKEIQNILGTFEKSLGQGKSKLLELEDDTLWSSKALSINSTIADLKQLTEHLFAAMGKEVNILLDIYNSADSSGQTLKFKRSGIVIEDYKA